MKNTLQVVNGLRYDDMEPAKKAIAQYMHKHLHIKPGDKVAVKPNLLGPFHPDKAATTHPEALRCVIEALLPYKCEIWICEDIDSKDTLKKCGIDVLLEEYGLSFYNLREYGYKTITIADNEYHYSDLVLSCNHLIQIPKLKTHMLTSYSGAIKNMYGCLAKFQKKELHKALDSDDFSNIICSVYAVRKPDLVIMDAVIAMEGMGPSVGNPKYLGKVVIGSDSVLVDYYAASFVGYAADELQMLQIAFDRGLANSDPKELEIIDGDIGDRCPNFAKLPVYHGKHKQKYFSLLKRSYSINYDICIGCGKCAESCPFNALTMQDCKPVFESKKCMLCICCIELCPVNAINTGK